MKGAAREPDSRTEKPSTSILKVVLSSGISVTAFGVLFTLMAIMYRVGLLARFQLSSDGFLPDTATELTLSGYYALLEVFARTQENIWGLVMYVAASVAAGCVMALTTAYVLLTQRRRVRRAKATLVVLSRRPMRIAALASAGIVLLGSAIPWIGITIAAFFIVLPIPAYQAGQRNAEKIIKDYPRIAAEKTRCTTIRLANKAIGTCPVVLVQSKEKIAYLDGSRVFVIPSKDLEMNWELKPSKDLAK